MGYTTLVVLIGTAVLGACSGMVGSFAVLRRRALMGDALAHAALPGVCIAFLLIGERHLPAMLVGAFVTGLLGVGVVSGLRWGTRIKEDAALGIVLSVFYGAGIAMLRYIQNQTVRGSKAGIESYILGQTTSMILTDVYFITGVALFSLALIFLLYKEFQVVTFDAEFAYAQGWPSFRLDLMLMLMIAVTVVIGLPAVGVVLMAALLIIPAAAARFWTDRLGRMLVIAAVLGAATGAGGTLASSRYDWAAGPAIVLTGTGFFIVSMLFGPKRGLLWQWLAERAYRRDVAIETQLRNFHEHETSTHPRPLPPATLQLLSTNGLIVNQSGKWAFTETGKVQADQAVLAYHMIDLYLSEYAGQIGDTPVTTNAALVEQIPPETQRELRRRLAAKSHKPESQARE